MRLPTRLLRRKRKSHKGDFGHIFILAGSPGLSGAAVLCAEAALRCGAGLVTLGIPKNLNNAIIRTKPKEAMTLPLPQTKSGSLSNSGYKKIVAFAKKSDILAIGPGLSQDKSTKVLIRKLIEKIKKPIVLDADGLNAMAGHLSILSRRKGGLPIILTPHPGEMSRLAGIKASLIQKKRREIAAGFAKRYAVTLVLKGNRSIVAEKKRLYINKTGNPGMSTAGSGDVLCGMIAAFLGQGLNAFLAAKYAVYLHGLAGDLAAKEKTEISLIASDIIAKIPAAIKKCS